MAIRAPKTLPLFGPPKAWRQSEFTASDDRVRGGSSVSHLEVSAALDTARFHGNLDTSTLGGAGFASQRTTATDKVWDLRKYNGIEILYNKGDGKNYTLNIKTQIPEKMANGRDASTLEYAYSFKAGSESARIWAPWSEFRPFYRGRPKEDAPPLDTSKIMRFSIMLRSFFDEEGQIGPFSITLKALRARLEPSAAIQQDDVLDGDWDDCELTDDLTGPKQPHRKQKGFTHCAIL